MKNLSKGLYIPIEALILYMVLFFPSALNFTSIGPPIQGSISFSIHAEIIRFLTRIVPSLALLWYIIIPGRNSDRENQEKEQLIPLKFSKGDLFSLGIALTGLISIVHGLSFMINLLYPYINFALPPKIEAPNNIYGWIVLVFTCLASAYLEESYFRYYLIGKLEKEVPKALPRLVFSTVLFSICHSYAGLFAIINAALAGILLSLLFIRFKSLHGIGLAHGAYNLYVYLTSSV